MFSAKQILAIVSCIVVVFASVPVALAANENDAKSAIYSAQQQLIRCYQTFADADKAGANKANATELMRLQGILNKASVFLSKANLAFKSGDYDSAQNFATYCQQNLKGFVDAANSLKQSAEQHAYWDFMVNIIGSSVGAVSVVIGGFVVWTFLKRKYPSDGMVVR
jgi:hypothetical protein